MQNTNLHTVVNNHFLKLVQWFGFMYGLIYVFGFLVLFNYYLYLTDSGVFDFPVAQVFSTGLSTLVVVWVFLVFFRIPSFQEHSKIQFQVRLVGGDYNRQIYRYIYQYTRILVNLLLGVSMSVFLSHAYLVMDGDVTHGYVVLLFGSLMISNGLNRVEKYSGYERVFVVFYFLTVNGLWLSVLVKIVPVSGLGIYLIPALIMLCKYPLSSIIVNIERGGDLSQIFGRRNPADVSWIILILLVFSGYAVFYYPRIQTIFYGGSSSIVNVSFINGVGVAERNSMNVELMGETATELIYKNIVDDVDRLVRINKTYVYSISSH